MLRSLSVICFLALCFVNQGMAQNNSSFELVQQVEISVPPLSSDKPEMIEIPLGQGISVQLGLYRFSENYIYFSDAKIKSENNFLSLDGFQLLSKDFQSMGQYFRDIQLVLKPTAKYLPMTSFNSGYSIGLLQDTDTKKINLEFHASQLQNNLSKSDAKELFQKGYHLPIEQQVTRPQGLQLAVGNYHSCLLMEKGLKCWGYNSVGQLGIGDNQNRGGRLGQLGKELPYVDVDHSKIQEIVGGANQNCALFKNGKLKCWGQNVLGQLGLGGGGSRGDQPNEMGDNLPYLDLGNQKVISVASGNYHNCALLENNKVKCWGYNRWGQLGLGDRRARGQSLDQMGDNLPYVDLGSISYPVQLALGAEFSCALFKNGKIKCWGQGLYLGQGSGNGLGDDPNEMGDKLPFIDLGSEKAVALSARSTSTCALFENNGVKCWGRNIYGQLGLGDRETRGDQPGEMGENLPYLDLGTKDKIRKLVVGGVSVCVLFESHKVKCWGANSLGQLGQGDRRDRGDEPGEMGSALLYVDLADEKVVDIEMGNYHPCVLLQSSRVKCWGSNNYGQLGYGDLLERGSKVNEMGEYLGFSILGQKLSFE